MAALETSPGEELYLHFIRIKLIDKHNMGIKNSESQSENASKIFKFKRRYTNCKHYHKGKSTDRTEYTKSLKMQL